MSAQPNHQVSSGQTKGEILNKSEGAVCLKSDFSVEAGLIVFTTDGRAQFGWRDLSTGRFHSEADGRCINGVIGAIEFNSDIAH